MDRSLFPILLKGRAVAAPDRGDLWKSAVIAAGGTVSDTQLGRVKTLLAAIPTAQMLDLWPLAAENSQQATIGIINRNVGTPVGAPAFAANAGYTTGPAAYVRLIVPTAPWVQNTAMFGFSNRVDQGAKTLNYMGTINTDGTALTESYLHFSGANDQYCSCNSENAVTFGTGAGVTNGLFVTARSDSTTTKIYRNGTALFTWSGVNSNGLPNQAFCVGGSFDTSGVFNSGDATGAPQFSSAFIGAITGDVNVAAFNTALQAYLTSIGA